MQEIEGLADPGQVEPAAPREEIGALREGGQRLVGRHDHGVCAEGEAVRREPGVKAEVRPPGLVDDERDARFVTQPRERGHVADDADEGGLDEDDCLRVRRDGQRRGQRLGPDPVREPGALVDLGPDPDGLEPGQDKPGEDRLVEVPRDDRTLPGPRCRERERLVSLRGAVQAEAAEVSAPELRRETLGGGEIAAARVEVVGARRQREIVAQEVVGQVRRALVAGSREGRDARVGEKCLGGVGERGLSLIHGQGFLPDGARLSALRRRPELGGRLGRLRLRPRPGSVTRFEVATISATETTMAAPAASIERVISSPSSVQPRNTATIGFTYA